MDNDDCTKDACCVCGQVKPLHKFFGICEECRTMIIRLSNKWPMKEGNRLLIDAVIEGDNATEETVRS